MRTAAGPRHDLEDFGDRQAALLIFGGFLRGGDNLRIDEQLRLPRLFLVLDEIHHHDALRHADLDGGETDAGGGVHGVEHVVHEGAESSSVTASTGAETRFSSGSGRMMSG